MVRQEAMRGAIKIKVQLLCGEEIAMGPGKADLLDAIAREGSISAAARALGMSYRRAWLLVDTMNRCWNAPLVTAQTGGGAQVTEAGGEVLDFYRAVQRQAEGAADGPEMARLARLVRNVPLPARDGTKRRAARRRR
ncbi:LysR family transcriptional regulator [Croceicoccus sp. BE223]|uniref:winged helix-turn-helix domain-containing protein n=1 Tax=Croceicoccus sp. BE223 TaxID=2817716 RepID=UPI00285D1D3B|nr:LysR family transcriptional regulator [Croceicoccus sp. BE223]MDR7102728.1 molybdate transport system regulatory protein [Croceicoccus sp. BE223]